MPNLIRTSASCSPEFTNGIDIIFLSRFSLTKCYQPPHALFYHVVPDHLLFPLQTYCPNITSKLPLVRNRYKLKVYITKEVYIFLVSYPILSLDRRLWHHLLFLTMLRNKRLPTNVKYPCVPVSNFAKPICICKFSNKRSHYSIHAILIVWVHKLAHNTYNMCNIMTSMI